MTKTKVLKSFICLVLAIRLLTTSIFAYPSTESIATVNPEVVDYCKSGGGDVNGNGVVSASDAMATLRASIGLTALTESQKLAADTNYDNKVTVIDALSILQTSAGLKQLSKRYKVYGMNFSPYTQTGQNPDSANVTEAQIIDLMNIIIPYTRWIRTCSAANDHANIGSLAHERGLKVALTARLKSKSTEEGIAANQVQIDGLINQKDFADMFIMGNNTFSEGVLSATDYIAYVNQVKAAAPDVKVAMSDSCDAILANPEVIGIVDTIIVNISPFKAGVSVDSAVTYLTDKYQQVLNVAGEKEVIISAGWPSYGGGNGDAMASVGAEDSFLNNFENFARVNGVKTFYDEAYNDASGQNNNEKSYGIFNGNKTIKVGKISDVFNVVDGE